MAKCVNSVAARAQALSRIALTYFPDAAALGRALKYPLPADTPAAYSQMFHVVLNVALEDLVEEGDHGGCDSDGTLPYPGSDGRSDDDDDDTSDSERAPVHTAAATAQRFNFMQCVRRPRHK